VNLVVVSNRVARGSVNEPITGGLAAALLPVVEKSGAIWVGSSGRVRDGAQKEPFAEIEALGAGALAMLDLPAAHYGGYYEGFANSALWPALHSRADLIRACEEDYLSYREVNAFMARALLRFRKPDAVFWIQDYHFLALGAELRDRGVTQPIGFFLHTPWPAHAVIEGVPHHRELVEAMLAYDLIGFQTKDDCENFLSYVSSDLRLEIDNGVITSRHGKTRVAVFPIGIDVEKFAYQSAKAVSHPDVSRLRRSLTRDRRRPAGLFQGTGQPHQGVRPDVEPASGATAHGVAAADRNAVARRDRSLRQSAERACKACQRRQRPAWRSRLDSDPLSQQRL
jgi:trehalose 6-phosphate synthase